MGSHHLDRGGLVDLGSITTTSEIEAARYLTLGLRRPITIEPPLHGSFALKAGARLIGGMRLVKASYSAGATIVSPPSSGCLSLLLAGSGRQLCQRSGKRIELEPGQLLVTDSASVSTITCGDQSAHRLVEIDLAEVEQLLLRQFDRPIVVPSRLIAHLAGRDPLAARIVTILNAIEDCLAMESDLSAMSHPLRLLCDAAIMAVVDAVPQITPLQAAAPTMPIGSPQLQQAIDFIRAQTGPVTVQDAAEAAGIGVRALQIAFKHQLGVTPGAYLKRARLEGVRNELQDTRGTLSLRGVARRWGFLNAGSFAADFRAAFGELPSQLRRSHRH